MDIVIKTVQFLANTFHTDNKTVVIAIIVALAILTVVQIVKKLIKLATTVVIVICLLVQVQMVQAKLENSYGITFDGQTASINVDIGTQYDTYNKQFIYSQKDDRIYVNSDGNNVLNISINDITQVNISNSSDIQIITIEKSDGTSSEIITDSSKGNIVYLIMKTTGAVGSAKGYIKA